MEEIRVRSWAELNERLYERSWDARHGRFRSAYVFRGLPDFRYDRRTSLNRLGGNYAELEDDLLEELAEELLRLRDTPAQQIDTTLLVHPRVLTDFLEYNDFLDRVDALIEALELDGVLQVASFHPQYRFADTEPDDPGNGTNRAPFPTLHLIREASLDRAVAAYPDPDAIVQRNLETMERLGLDGLQRLLDAE